MLSFGAVVYNLLRRPSSTVAAVLTSTQMRNMSSQNSDQLLEMVKGVIPPLEYSRHKGQAGRIAVIGGCQEYTGAPYFAAISALKVGCDLIHVFCTADASPVIKSYSPELIVHPILDSPNASEEISNWLPRFHSLVIGPGLGRDETILGTASRAIEEAKRLEMPLVIDADGLFLIVQDPSIISGYPNAILTPNIAEFERLYKKVLNKSPDKEEPVIYLKELCKKMGNVTIVQKGFHDIISDGKRVLICTQPGSPRRCGGQGDLLSGSMGAFSSWSKAASKSDNSGSFLQTYGYLMCAAYAACCLTRECNRRAFQTNGRSMTTTDMIQQIHDSFDFLFSS